MMFWWLMTRRDLKGKCAMRLCDWIRWSATALVLTTAILRKFNET